MWPNPQFPTADLVTFTEEILNEKLHFLCSDGAALKYSKVRQSLYNKLGHLVRLAKLINVYNKLSDVLQTGKTLS